MRIEKIYYGLTDWIYFFNKKNQDSILKIISKSKNKAIKEELVTWKLITVFLPIVPFATVLILNIVLSLTYKIDDYLAFFNNGSIPIISFGILTSGMPYLLEQLQVFPEYHSIRRRVMGVALFFLFLSASLYIIQTLSLLSQQINTFANVIILIFSVFVFLCSKSIGVKMFVLKSKNIESFEENVNDGVKDLKDAVKDLD